MTKINKSRELKNLVRGGSSFRQSRHRLTKILTTSDHDITSSLNPYLVRSLFSLKPGNWFVLSFDSHDWQTVEDLQKRETPSLQQNYLNLVTLYIIENADRVDELGQANKKISRSILEDDGQEIDDILSTFDEVDRQSLFYFRSLCATNSARGDELVETFKSHKLSGWLEKRFLYPLVYYTVNTPTDQKVSSFLSHVLSGNESNSERATIRHLLNDEDSVNENLSFKCYLGLLSHPFDALEFLLSHIELNISIGRTIDGILLNSLERVVEHTSSTRAQALLGLAKNEDIPFSISPPSDQFIISNLREETREWLLELVSFDSKQKGIAGKSLVLRQIIQLAEHRYPEYSDFQLSLSNAQRWRHTDVGRLLYALMSSMYLFPRTKDYLEHKEMFRLITAFGGANPSIICSPRGRLALKRFDMWGDRRASIAAEIDLQLLPSVKCNNRDWIKFFQWELQDYELNMNMSYWFSAVRQQAEVTMSYVCGVDWNWFKDVTLKMRLARLRGSVDAAYVHLLQKVEENTTDTTMIRKILAPVLSNLTLAEAVDWFIDEYQNAAPAFVYHYFSTETLLLSEMAANETAAIACRIQALYLCVSKVGYTEILTESVFDEEARSLSSTLFLRRVSKGQFEIPWEIFRKEAIVNHADLFKAQQIIHEEHAGHSLLGSSHVATPFRFPNEQLKHYSFRNSDWPLANFILQVICDFIQHSSFGLEAILSIRIRHDLLKREYEQAIRDVKTTTIPGVAKYKRELVCTSFEDSVGAAVTKWLDTRMHSARSVRPQGLFDITPSQEDLGRMISDFSSRSNYEDVVQGIIDWLTIKLDQELDKCRRFFETEIADVVQDASIRTRETLADFDKYRPLDVDRTATVIEASLSRTTQELVEWFRAPEIADRHQFTIEQIKLATDGRFEKEILQGAITTSISTSLVGERRVPVQLARLFFDLLSEAYANAIKHADLEHVRLRIGYYAKGGTNGIVISNMCTASASKYKTETEGRQYDGALKDIFKEGNSGLAKIASISAAILDEITIVRATRKKFSFHLQIPIWQE